MMQPSLLLKGLEPLYIQVSQQKPVVPLESQRISVGFVWNRVPHWIYCLVIILPIFQQLHTVGSIPVPSCHLTSVALKQNSGKVWSKGLSGTSSSWFPISAAPSFPEGSKHVQVRIGPMNKWRSPFPKVDKSFDPGPNFAVASCPFWDGSQTS